MAKSEIPVKVYFGEIEEITKQLGKLQTYKLFEGADEELVDVNEVMRILAGHVKVTTAEPERKTGKWIPCSERLPEDRQFVLMTIRRMGERYNHESFISIGYISWNQSVWWCAHDGDCKSHNVRVDAWMPLPKPYSERRQDE